MSLTPEQVRRLTKIGSKSETFCRQTAAILEQNEQALPPGFDLEELKRDFAASMRCARGCCACRP